MPNEPIVAQSTPKFKTVTDPVTDAFNSVYNPTEVDVKNLDNIKKTFLDNGIVPDYIARPLRSTGINEELTSEEVIAGVFAKSSGASAQAAINIAKDNNIQNLQDAYRTAPNAENSKALQEAIIEKIGAKADALSIFKAVCVADAITAPLLQNKQPAPKTQTPAQ